MIPFKVLCRDRVAGGLNYRGQAHGCRFGALALGDVKKGIDSAGDFAVSVCKNSRSRNHLSPLAIRTFDDNFQIFRFQFFAA